MLSVYSKQSTALKNKIHDETILGNTQSSVVKSIKRSQKSIKKEVDLLEKQLLEIVKKTHQDLLTRLESIPGLSRKTSMMLIVLTDGFNRFETVSALCSYSGLTPTIRQSGSRLVVVQESVKWEILNLEIYYLCAVLQHLNITKHARQFMIEL